MRNEGVPSRPCPVCGERSIRILYENPSPIPSDQPYRISEANPARPRRIVTCRVCSLSYADPLTSLKTLQERYAQMEDPEYLEEEAGRRQAARRLLRVIHHYHQPGRLLDVGCAYGFLLDEARQWGWEVHGLELSRWAADHAAKCLGLSVKLGKVENAQYPLGWFDGIVLIDVLEHLPDPRGTLEVLRRLLAPQGILTVVTPDFGGLASHLLGSHWWGIQEAHLSYFDKRTLKRLLEATGFTVMKWLTPPRTFSWAYWSRRLASYLPGFLRNGIEVFSHRPAWRHRQITLPLLDQIGCIARRTRTVALIPEWERDQEVRTPHHNAKVIAVLPAYRAANTLKVTVQDISREVVHETILVDDASPDETVTIARQMDLVVLVHERNCGYGAGQKTGYREALRREADIVVMVHPDYQYDPRVLPQLVAPIQEGWADAVFGSRMMKGGALEGGMPYWKWAGNILLTAIANVVTRHYLTEYHSGFRAYSTRALRSIRFEENSDGFVFDTQIILQLIARGFRITEIPIRTRYFDEASSIRRWPAFVYGLKILSVLILFGLHQRQWIRAHLFTPPNSPRRSDRTKAELTPNDPSNIKG